MPRGDRTGPWGMGPMTGRAAGYCAGYPVPGFMNPYGGRFGAGRGGFPYGGGRGRTWGGGRGWGWRGAVGAYGYDAGFYPGAYGYPPAPIYPQAPAQERKFLEEEAKALEEEMKAIRNRIEELRKEKPPEK